MHTHPDPYTNTYTLPILVRGNLEFSPFWWLIWVKVRKGFWPHFQSSALPALLPQPGAPRFRPLPDDCSPKTTQVLSDLSHSQPA